MLERQTRLMIESLARTMDRRRFLKRTGSALFMGVAALAAGQLNLSPASAKSDRRPPIPNAPACNPPGPYCNLDGNWRDPNGCHGASCYEHLYYGQVLTCRLWYGVYPTGCWTTPQAGGYWTCCDCQCGQPAQAMCGCAKWSGTPAPRPDGIGA